MVCHNCKCECKKFGFHHGFQRYRCRECGRTFSDIPERPLDDLRVPLDKAVQIVNMLVEGVGVRATARLAQVHRDTVLNVFEVAGQKCARLMDARVRNKPQREGHGGGAAAGGAVAEGRADPGRRSPTRFALGYSLSGPQPFRVRRLLCFNDLSEILQLRLT